jgi:hypothetical protein
MVMARLDGALLDLASVHGQQARHGPQERGLAGTVRSENGDD